MTVQTPQWCTAAPGEPVVLKPTDLITIPSTGLTLSTAPASTICTHRLTVSPPPGHPQPSEPAFYICGHSLPCVIHPSEVQS